MVTEQISAIWNDVRSSTRYRWIALQVAVAVCLLGWTVVLLMPDRYESKAQIFVTSDTILKPLLQGIAVSTDTGSAADIVRRALLARPNIERVARENGMLDRARTPEEVEAVYAGLQEDIKIAGGDPRLNLYVVSYTGANAVLAQAVVKTLIATFVQDSMGQVRTDTEGAQRFLEQQVDEYKQRLSQSEQRLAEFKNKHIGMMPTERGDYFSRLQEEQAKLDAYRADYNIALRQRDELRRKLVGATGDGKMPEMPTDQQIQSATEIDTQLQDVRRQLEAALLKYTDRHPEVLSLRDTITRLEQRRRTELGGVRATTSGGGAGSSIGGDAVLQSLQVQLNTVDVQVVTLGAQVAEAQRRVAELRRLLSVGTDVEAQLADLNRDYGVTKAQYDSLLQRLESARISGDADKSKDMTIRTMDPPRVPQHPIGPMRTLLVLGIFLFSVAVGAGVAYLLSMMRPVFVDAQQVAGELGIRMVGAISILRGQAEARVLKRRNLAFVAAGLALGLFSLGLAAFSQTASMMLRAAIGAT